MAECGDHYSPQYLNPGHARSPVGCNHDLSEEGIAIVHLKAIVHAETGFVKLQFAVIGEPQVEGRMDASPASHFAALIAIRGNERPSRIVESSE